MISERVLVCRSGRLCLLPLAAAIETMRPLPLAPLPGAPAWVAGVAVIRGLPTPVLDASALSGDSTRAPAGRLVTLRSSARVVGLAVQEVLGIRDLARSTLLDLAPLLSGEAAIASVSALDGEIAMVLRTARLVPEETWKALEAGARS
jgi:purine-binding chemotaxis protein CheW